MGGGPAKGYAVDTAALKTYGNNLSYYSSEADKFGNLVDQADVSNESWGVIGLFVKQTYTEKLTELRELLNEMKEGVEALTDKIGQAANIYDGMENDASIKFGQHEAEVDGPR